MAILVSIFILAAFVFTVWLPMREAIKRQNEINERNAAREQEPERVYVPIYMPVFTPFAVPPEPENKEETESQYWDGPKPTPAQQRLIDKQMDEFLEKMPNAGFFEQHPEYVDKYIDKIDLSELDEALGKK